MKRIVELENYWHFTPDIQDFKALDANLLINRMHTLYTLRKNNKVEMVHVFQISDVLKESKHNIDFNTIVCNAIEKIPDLNWEKVVKVLDLYNGTINSIK